jgi:hypothetical protein
VNAAARSTTAIVLAHLLVNILHGRAHRILHVDLTPVQLGFVLLVIFAAPLIAMVLVWTSKRRAGLILLAASMFASLLFGLYHHFVASGPDHVHAQPAGPWSLIFVLTAYGLLITEAIGAYVGIHFLAHASVSPENPSQQKSS